MKNLLTLKKYFARYKTKLFLGFLFILLSNAGTLYIPLVIKDAINSIDKSVETQQLVRYALIIVGAAFFGGTISLFN